MLPEVAKEGKYIYCITYGGGLDSIGSPVAIGGRGDLVDAIPYNNLACIVSNSPITEYPVTRENTMVHQKVIEAVMKLRPILPVRFGTIGVSEQVIVEKVLEARTDELQNLLTWVSDKHEFGVKVFWREPERVLRELAAKSGKVGVLVGALTGQKPEATYYDRIEVGKMLQDLLKEKREEMAEYITNALKKYTCESKVNSTYGEAMILNGAFFVPISEEASFQQAVEILEKELGENVRVKLITDAPPFNFVTIKIHWEDSGGISSG